MVYEKNGLSDIEIAICLKHKNCLYDKKLANMEKEKAKY